MSDLTATDDDNVPVPPPLEEPLVFVDPVDVVEGGVPDGADPDDANVVTGDDPDFDQGGGA